MSDPEILWAPPDDVRRTTRIGAYLDWLHETRKLDFPDYESLWRWSVTDIEEFWFSLAEYFEIE